MGKNNNKNAMSDYTDSKGIRTVRYQKDLKYCNSSMPKLEQMASTRTHKYNTNEGIGLGKIIVIGIIIILALKFFGGF